MSAAFTFKDVAYHAPGGVELLARLYRPTRAGPHPAVVGAHGGRWCAETRLTNASLDSALAAAGIVVMALDFRAPPQARYPEPVADINAGIRWLKAHAADYDVRADAIGGLGTSSGGHQLLLNALTPHDPRFQAEHPAALASVDPALAFLVACWPVSDPPARYAYAIDRHMDLHVRSHDAYWPNVAAMAEGSPQRIVEEGEATHRPPMLIVHGDADDVLTPDMAQRFVAAYRAAGGQIELRLYEGEGHTFITKKPDAAASHAAIKAIAAFIHVQIAAPLTSGGR